MICCDSYLVKEDLQNHTGEDNTSRGGIQNSKKLCEEVNQHDSLKAYLSGRFPWPAHSLSFRASIVSLLLQRPDQMYWWDFEEFLVAVGATIGKFKLIPQALTLYRIHEAQATNQHKENLLLNSLHFRTTNFYLQAKNLEQRISKLRHCQSILYNAQKPEQIENINQRLHTIEDALCYHNTRLGIIQNNRSARRFLAESLALSNQGYYHKYAQGTKSMIADLVRFLWLRIGD